MNNSIQAQIFRGSIFWGLMILSASGFGQSDYSMIDESAKWIPDSITAHTEIAAYVTRNATSEKEKARAIYIWISHNIQYDLRRIYSSRRYNSPQDIVEEVIKTRKGVCQHYSELFLAMSRAAGLKSYLISGYTRDGNGEIADIGHAWNAVEIDSAFYLNDVTWAAGYEDKGKYVHDFQDKYFLISPKEFIKDHMPFDPIWQFMDNPLNHKDFISKDFSKLARKGDFAYRDSIQQHENHDKISRLVQSNNRIRAYGVENSLIKRQVDENILQIANSTYSLAIDTLNYGIDYYNAYIAHKNSQFNNPALDDAAIKELIDNAGYGMYAADLLLSGLSSSNRELNKMIVDARNRMPELLSALKKEEAFVNGYLKRWKPMRIYMFQDY